MGRLGERTTARRGVQSDESPELRESGRGDSFAVVWPRPWSSKYVSEFRWTAGCRQFRTGRRVDPRLADRRPENSATSAAFRVLGAGRIKTATSTPSATVADPART